MPIFHPPPNILCICIIHVLNLQCVFSIFASRKWTLKYNLPSQCLLHSQEEWQAISKGFAWIQTFHYRESCWIKTCLSTIYQSWTPRKVILYHYCNYKNKISYLIFMVSSVCNPVGYVAKTDLSVYSSTRFQSHLLFFSQRKLLVTINDVIVIWRALHYGRILLQRVSSPDAGEQADHFTCTLVISFISTAVLSRHHNS